MANKLQPIMEDDLDKIITHNLKEYPEAIDLIHKHKDVMIQMLKQSWLFGCHSGISSIVNVDLYSELDNEFYKNTSVPFRR